MMAKAFYCLRTPVLGFVVLSLVAGCEPIPSKQLNEEQKRADMYWLFSQFGENYAPLDYKMNRLGKNYEELKREFLDEAIHTPDNQSFYSVMFRFVAQFKDAHTSAVLSSGGFKNRAQVAYLGFSGKRKGDALVVTEILPTYDLAHSDYPIRVGDEITHIDGIPLPRYIRENLIQYRDLGSEEANLTYHMNQIFNRSSLSGISIPAEGTDVLLTLSKRGKVKAPIPDGENKPETTLEATAGTSSDKPEDAEDVGQEVQLPWVIKDLADFTQDQAVALAKPVPKKAETFDLFTLLSPESGAVSNPLHLGLRGFDGNLRSPSRELDRLKSRDVEFGYFDSFFFPEQVESWTAQVKVSEDGRGVPIESNTLAKLKEKRFVPADAVFMTAADAIFPTYVSSEKLHGLKGEAKEGTPRLVATMFLDTFAPAAPTDQVKKEVLLTLDKLRTLQVRHLVIDLINNGGGSIVLGMELAQALTNKKIKMPSMEFRASETWINQFERMSVKGSSDTDRELARRVLVQLREAVDGGHRLTQPLNVETLVPYKIKPNLKQKAPLQVVLMVNEMCASMCDIFAGILQDNRMATIVGTQTMGAGGNVVAHPEAPNSHLTIRQTESLIRRSNGSYIENIGIQPDVLVEVSKDVSNKYKTVRAEAIKVLTESGSAEEYVDQMERARSGGGENTGEEMGF